METVRLLTVEYCEERIRLLHDFAKPTIPYRSQRVQLATVHHYRNLQRVTI